MNNCIRKIKVHRFTEIINLRDKIKVKDSKKDKLIKEVASLIVSEMNKFHDEGSNYEKKNNHIDRLLEVQKYKEKFIQDKFKKKLKECIERKKKVEQNKIVQKYEIEMEDINDFLKDQSKNTLQDYYEKLKTGGNEYANLYLEEITIAIIEHKNEKIKE